MKKIMILMLCILCMTMFSFFKNAQPAALRKVSKNLYEVKTTRSLNVAGQVKLRAIIAKEYGIRSFNETVLVHYIPEKDLKGNGVAMAEEKLSSSAFQQTILEDGNEEVKQSCIYTNCSSNPAISDILQILATYNTR